MGLDQTLSWVGKPSIDQVRRLHHENLSEIDRSIGMMYIDLEDECYQKMYKEIMKYMIPEEIYQNETDWDMIRKECGMPLDAQICGIGHNSVTFGRAMNLEGCQTFPINTWNKKYWKPVKHTMYFFLEDELYRWRNNYDVQEIFNKAHPDEWCDYKQKYEMINCGMYKLKKSELNKIMKLDNVFAAKWHYDIKNIFYSANW